MKNVIQFAAVALGVIFFSAMYASAGDLAIPNTFNAGERAVAEDVNTNFTAVETAVDDNNLRINGNTADIATNESEIAANASDISTNTSNITGNAANIATNTSDISTNASDIAANSSDLAGMPGIAYLDTGNNAIYPAQTDREVISLTINAPTAGHVLATYGGSLYFTHTTGTQDVGRVWMNTDGGQNGEGAAFRYFSIYPALPSAAYYYSVSLHLAMPVSAGNTTFYVITDGSQGDTDQYIRLYENSLSIQFFPNNYEAP